MNIIVHHRFQPGDAVRLVHHAPSWTERIELTRACTCVTFFGVLPCEAMEVIIDSEPPDPDARDDKIAIAQGAVDAWMQRARELEATMRQLTHAPGRCPTPCDENCGADCHEAHEVLWKRSHQVPEGEE